jgi:hypothetical protein
MAKTMQAQNIANINDIRFETDDKGQLTKLEVNCEVNYGKFGMMESVDLIPELNAAQKKAAQAFYETLKSKLEKVILG